MRIVEILKGSYEGATGFFHGFFQVGNIEHGCDPVAVVEFEDGRCDEFSSSYIRFESQPAEIQGTASHFRTTAPAGSYTPIALLREFMEHYESTGISSELAEFYDKVSEYVGQLPA